MPTILVVEDEMLIRLHVTDFLRDCGFEVIEAADGARALEILDAGVPVDAVFSDVTLPGDPDGLGLARWIRARKPGLPVVLTSGEVNAEHVALLGEERPAFFPKPCDYAQVATHIHSLLAADAG